MAPFSSLIQAGLRLASTSTPDPKDEVNEAEEEQDPKTEPKADPSLDPSSQGDVIKTWAAELLNTTVVRKVLPELGNLSSILGNLISTHANAFNYSKEFKNKATYLGELGTKAFLITNGAINSLEQLMKRNYLSAFGYFNDILVGSIVSQKNTYLARGFSVGNYTAANGFSILNGRDKFNSLGDHLNHLKSAIGKTVNNIRTGFVKSLLDSESGMCGALSGVFTNLGAMTWLLTGNEKLGDTIRDLGGILVDLEQANPGHLKAGRRFYFLSGVGLMGGTVCDLLSKWVPSKQHILVPLSLMIDGIGRYILRISQNAGELSQNFVKVNANS